MFIRHICGEQKNTLGHRWSSVFKPLNFTIFFYKTNFVNNVQYLPKHIALRVHGTHFPWRKVSIQSHLSSSLEKKVSFMLCVQKWEEIKSKSVLSNQWLTENNYIKVLLKKIQSQAYTPNLLVYKSLNFMSTSLSTKLCL